MKSEFFEESMELADRCIKDLQQKEADKVCSDCTLAIHQLKQAGEGELELSHPILELYKAYGFNNN